LSVGVGYGVPVRDPDPRWLEAAVRCAVDNVGAGGGPFGALVVRADELLAEGVNRVTRDRDPTAHAEVVAIRAACRRIGHHALPGCVLVSSCEPCPLCLSAALWARVDAVVYAADRDDAARAGFDDRAFHHLFEQPRQTWPMPVRRQEVAQAQAPFEAWLASPDREAY
jgi:guanine deaminase